MTEGTRHRLAAILAADVVGYSRLIAADEVGTLAAMRLHRSELWDPTTEAYGGRLVGTAGDSRLVEFPSAVAAVECAVAIQRGMIERNADISDDRRIRLRIGINLGDVVVDGDDIHGDGVNIAARLEAEAEPDGVCVSDDVMRQVRGRLDIQFKDGGERELKNIAHPIRVWHWALVTSMKTPAETQLALSETPSIVVLPFENMSADAAQQFFCDGIAEDVITALSKVSRLKVIARNSSFAYKGQSPDIRHVAEEMGVRYVLEGSVRSGDNRIRVTAQLIDASDGSHLWAERYDRRVDDVFEIQDEIVKEIVANLRVRFADGEQALAIARGTCDVEAWQHCVMAWDLFLKFDASAHLRARELAEKAIALDAHYAAARAIAGWTFWFEGRMSLGVAAREKFDAAEVHARHAWALDETDPMVIGLNALLAAAFDRHSEGVDLAERGIVLHPGNADMRAHYGFTLMYAGRYNEALPHFEAAISLNPVTPTWYYNGYARTLLSLGRHEEALAITERMLEQEVAFQQAWIYRAYACECLGRKEDARRAMAEILRLAPLFRRSHLPNLFLQDDPEMMARFTEVLGRVGLPA